VPLAWFRTAQEEQEEILGKDPWAYGLSAANRKNLETLIEYSFEQSLIAGRMALEELFCESTR
jgi:4,5-dihydroxyphthalate decarboxylase